MFKSLFSLLKALFTTANRATKALDDVTSAGLYYSETFLQEAYKENEKRSKELDVDQEAFQESLKKIRSTN